MSDSCSTARILLLSVACLCTASPIAFADASDAALQQNVQEYNDKQDNPEQKVVCRNEQITGSRLTEKVCRTVGQMKYDEHQAKKMLDKPRPYVTQGQ